MRIICLVGIAGSGKDTVARMIEEMTPKCTTVAFADAVKWGLAESFSDIDPEWLFGSSRLRRMRIPRTRVVIRDALEAYGAALRDLDQDIWCTQLFRIIKKKSNFYSTFVIKDARHYNEWLFSKRLGAELWYISRPSAINQKLHSEKDIFSKRDILDKLVDKYIANDGTLVGLRHKVCVALG